MVHLQQVYSGISSLSSGNPCVWILLAFRHTRVISRESEKCVYVIGTPLGDSNFYPSFVKTYLMNSYYT